MFLFQRQLLLLFIFSYKQYQDKGTRTKGWSYKHGYENTFNTDVYPLRGLAANKNNDLKLRLQMNLNDLVNSNDEYPFGHGFAVSGF